MLVTAAAALVAAGLTVTPAPATAAHGSGAHNSGDELTVSDRLADRRTVTIGDRFYEVGAADGSYPATGWHVRGEMGGFWSQPIKLLDGLWFAVDGTWLKAKSFTSGYGYTRMDLGGGVQRTDVVPDGNRAGLVGLHFDGGARQVRLTVDAHSELLKAYPWSGTTPSQDTVNLPDTGSFDGRDLVFQEQPNHYAALVGAQLTPDGHQLGPDFRGPQDPAVICPNTDPAPARCDDGPAGKGTGGQLTYTLDVPKGGRTVWFAVAGSDQGKQPAQAALAAALRDPSGQFARKQAQRREVSDRTHVDLPGDPLLAQSVEWSKQNLADTVQESRDLHLFASDQGTQSPPLAGTLAQARWIGAGWPDYPWIFGTDGEYTAFAAVAAGDFEAIEDHLRTLRDVSDIVNAKSGKVVHEVTPDGQVYYGTNDDPGNTDETVKFPSAVALVWRWTGDDSFRDSMYDFSVRAMKYAVGLDADGDGWPEGSGNVERAGMGAEKLDVAVYTIRGLADVAQLAASKGDTATADWANAQAASREKKFEDTFWYGGDAHGYADSLSDPGNVKLYQRYWIGLTPMEADLPGGPLASVAHADDTLAQHERACYNGDFGLFHTGTGPTSDAKGNPGPSCDSVVSSAPSDRETFSLGSAVAAVAEGNYGRLAQQHAYTTDNARIQLDPDVWELPGAMPEIAPSPDFGSNLSHDFLSRSSVLQAWGTYGVLWPVVAQQLGVAPDLGRGQLAVVPQIPPGQQRVAGSGIRLGGGDIDVTATRSGATLTTQVRRTGVRGTLTLGAVLPAGASVRSVSLDGHQIAYQRVTTTRGTEVRVPAGTGGGQHTLTVRLG
ncbi:hypothetical protein [Rugosimonospora africana]|uniref:Glycogen debranching protein n=1 Tax=Rugosimonospora africana TaxID=556532 RepID=A0A8J3VRH5_9ACTN|nr:hypothetical protein [Rugosimonospora africana]GIH15403.1 hypothetical protein Raf01_35750 [Rugosimonospora africana]